MPSSIASDILSQMDWDEGISVPVANEENKVLEDDIQSKATLITRLRAELAENEDRIYSIQEYMKNVRQESQHTNALIHARGTKARVLF